MNYQQFYNEHYRASTDDVRFTGPMLMGVYKTPRNAKVDEQIRERGALAIGPARLTVGGKTVVKKRVLSVKRGEWNDFVREMEARPIMINAAVGDIERKEKPLTLAQRVERLEKQLGITI